MVFVETKYNDLYNKLFNNNKLRNFLLENKALMTVNDYYENYSGNDFKSFVEENNKQVYKNLTELLLPEQTYIKQKTIEYLIASEYNKDEIKYACGFSTDTVLTHEFYHEIFYTCKYCYTESFFQNNWKYFIPECDFEELENNEAAYAFMDAIMKEFDQLDYILKNTKDFKDYKKIPFEYINYLSQLLGIEQKTFMIDSDMAAQYRVLAENIIDVYRQRGTDASWELLFNFLGFNVNIEEYYFDRRKYFSIAEENEELSEVDLENCRYYLTTIDPRSNYLQELATDEIVTDADFSELKNIKNFNQLVKDYGLMCVLGYDDVYTSVDEFGNTVMKEYTGDVYKYFKTNYLRIKPTLKYESGNFTINQLYQLTCLLNFLTPEFVQRELYTVIDTGNEEEKIILNYSRDANMDGFYILDSEDWDQSFAEKYLTNFSDYKNNEVPFSIQPKIADDLNNEKDYLNSLGEKIHYANNKYYNVFFNPLSEKIQRINSTKYWGDKIKVEDSSGKVYPVWRTDMDYTFGEIKHEINLPYKDSSGNMIKELYLPEHANLFSNDWLDNNWNNVHIVDLNGSENYTIRNGIRSMNNYIDVKWSTNLPIELFLKEDLTDEELKNLTDEEKETRNNFFEKRFIKVRNFCWKKIYTFDIDLDADDPYEYLKEYLNSGKNIINYDYINKELLCDDSFTNLSLDDENCYITSNEFSTKIINRLDGGDCYYISCNKDRNKFYIFKACYDISSYKYIPVKTNKTGVIKFSFDTYEELLNCYKSDGTFYNSKTNETFETKKLLSYLFYVVDEKQCYKTTLSTNKKLNKELENQPLENGKIGKFVYNDETLGLYQYKYKNIYKNDLIYSTYNNKLYVITSDGACAININSDVLKEKIISKNSIGVFGVNEVNFYGKLKCENEKYRIYEYDSNYQGFSEQDDDDNYVLNNFERIISWENLGIGKTKISRPIREKTDLDFDSKNDNNEIANNILKEIFDGIEDKFSRSNLISWE